MATCDYCRKEFDILTGLYDDGDFMCGECMARYAEESDRRREQQQAQQQLLQAQQPHPAKK